MELPLPELSVGARVIPLRGKAFALEALLAADAADSLEVVLGSEGLGGIKAGAGEQVLFRLGGEERFRGRAERAGVRLTREEGSVAELTARAEWLERALALSREEEYREVTDSEIAARIADSLGLSGRIDPTPEVHGRIRRMGDPLEFLLERGRTSGRIAGLSGGELHFSARLPASPSREIGPSAPVLAFRASRHSRGRSGAIVLAYDPGVAPLDRLRLPGFGPACEGALRVARVRIRLDSQGFSTEVIWVEEGADLALAREEEAGWDRFARAPGPRRTGPRLMEVAG